jgi:hypothetical protein
VNNSLTDVMETDNPTATSNNSYSLKQRKITPPDNLVKRGTEHNKWLNNIPISNPFSILTELDDEPTGSNTTTIEKQQPKPSPVYIEYTSKLKSQNPSRN